MMGGDRVTSIAEVRVRPLAAQDLDEADRICRMAFGTFLGLPELVSRSQFLVPRLDRGQMILMSASGQTWQFEADDNAQWRRVPDTADPLIMMRGQ